MRKRWFPVALACLALAAVGPSAARAEEPPAPPAAAGAPAVKVTLLDAGAAPHRALRYTAAAGARQRMVMLMKMGMKMSMGGMDMPAQVLPGMRMGAEVEVVKVEEDGRIRLATTFGEVALVDEPGVLPQVKAAMEGAMAGLKGLAVDTVLTPRGAIVEMEVRGGENLAPATRQQVESMKAQTANLSIPLPEEAVGVGARWTAEQTVHSGSLALSQTTTLTLVKAEGGGVEISMELDQTAPEQDMKNSDLPPGTTMRVKKVSGKGAGRLVVDLAYCMPSISEMRLATEMDLTMRAGEAEHAMANSVTVEMTLESEPVATTPR